MLGMKTALVLLVILVVVTVRPAWAFQCHVCTSSTNCKKPQTCPSSSQYCMTVTIVEPLSGNLVEKNCADFCVPSSSQQGQVSSGTRTRQCCQGNLCNEELTSAAPARGPLGTPVLGPALGLLTVLSALRL